MGAFNGEFNIPSFSLYSVASGDKYKFSFTAKISSQNGVCAGVSWLGASEATVSEGDDKSMLVEIKEPSMDEDVILKATYEANDTPYIVVEPGQKGIIRFVVFFVKVESIIFLSELYVRILVSVLFINNATLTIFFGPRFFRRAENVPDEKKKQLTFVCFLSPPVHFARWTHMRRFLSVRLSVCLSGLDQKSDWIIIHISESIRAKTLKLCHIIEHC